MGYVIFISCIGISTVLFSVYINEIEDFIIKHSPINANKIRKVFIKRERKQIKTTIFNKQTSCSYIMIYIEYKENIKWLQRKGFNITDSGLNHRYKISWGDNE